MQKAVVIVHGLFMSTLAMKLIERRFRMLGYHTYNFGYRSRQYSPQTLKRLHSFCLQVKEDDVLFVGHSLGGLVICDYLLHYPSRFKSTKIVTLGTPFYGSQIVHALSHTKVADWLFGQNNTQQVLLDGFRHYQSAIPIGVITGTVTMGVGLFFGLDDGDGTVSQAESDVPWATDKATIRTNHLGLIYSQRAVQLADTFFNCNHF